MTKANSHPAEYDAWRAARWDEIAGPNGKVKVVSADKATGAVTLDPDAVEKSGLTGIDTYPYDPAWVFEGEYRAVPDGRLVEVGRLTEPPTTQQVAAPVDLAVTIDGTEYVLAVIEDFPGQRLVVFTDETNGDGTPEIGRWLVLPVLEPGSRLTIDFNQVTLSHHHLSPTVFTCPLAPDGNHLPLRIEAGERSLVFSEDVSRKGKAIAYLRHLENREWDKARAMCTEKATVWHNDGKGDSSIDENISGMQAQIGGIESMRYDVVRQFAAEDGVLQQHAVHVETKDGQTFRLDAAVYVGFEDGLISRLEEYAGVPVPDSVVAP
ncbi:DUF1684 domain-containing protein [Kribbella sp. NBC_01505]|uniref:DUF1684 domain-containing protein n=1 Tax=Kribbella sp. NBC_01505 TaxID=2903580 RepID=UPI00387083C6